MDCLKYLKLDMLHKMQTKKNEGFWHLIDIFVHKSVISMWRFRKVWSLVFQSLN